MQPQTTFVDVFYGGVFLVSTTATFTPTEISFESPEEIVERIADILEPDQVIAILTSEMPTNTEFSCVTESVQDCGRVDTETVDVIFDEGRFRADVFISPTLLSVRPLGISKFLPPSSAGLSLLNVIAATVNGVEGSTNNYNIGNSTTISYKETRLFAASNITRNEDLTVDTLALQREFNGQQFQAGVFRSNAGNLVFVGQSDFVGVNVGTSLDTRRDLDQSAGNDLQVFLETRSRVDILKDGRLVSTAVYETGNQIIDTSRLPGGAYDITLRIRDNAGGVREETRFYVKTNRLPPLDQALYFVDVGELVSHLPGDVLPTSTGEQIIRAGINKRLTASFGGELGGLMIDDQYLLESGFFQLGRSYDLRVNFALGSEDSRGASINARTRLGRMTLGGSARKIWSQGINSIIGASATQASVNLTMPIGRSSLNLSARYNQRETGTDENYGMRLDFPTFDFGNQMLLTNLSVTDNNGELLVLFGARLAWNNGPWNNQVSSRVYHERRSGLPTETGLITNAASSWQDGDRFLSDVNLTFRANDEQQDRSVEADLEVISNLGRTNLDAIYSLETDRVNYGASFFSSIMANKDAFSFGGRNQAPAALVLDIGGDTRDAFFDVRVNDMNRGSARIGETTVIGLAPFFTYDVSLVPRGNSIVDFNNNVRRATLYPGNVVTLNWEVTRVLVAFGQIVDANGDPIANGLVEGVIGLATTDDFGFFQAELNSSTRSLNVRTRTTSCVAELPDYGLDDLVVMLDTLVCR